MPVLLTYYLLYATIKVVSLTIFLDPFLKEARNVTLASRYRCGRCLFLDFLRDVRLANSRAADLGERFLSRLVDASGGWAKPSAWLDCSQNVFPAKFLKTQSPDVLSNVARGPF